MAVAVALLAAAPALHAQPPDPEILNAIREEGFQRSQAMEIVSWLSDVYGPRVTGTPAIEAAKDWTADRMRAWGAAGLGGTVSRTAAAGRSSASMRT